MKAIQMDSQVLPQQDLERLSEGLQKEISEGRGRYFEDDDAAGCGNGWYDLVNCSDVVDDGNETAFLVADTHFKLKKKIDEKFSIDSIPTYFWTRYYPSGTWLSPHIDRGACEYSISLNVKTFGDRLTTFEAIDLEHLHECVLMYKMQHPDNPDMPGPGIWNVGEENWCRHDLGANQGVFYKGIDVLHFRKPTRDPFIQVFFHYVDLNGPFASTAYDRKDWYRDYHMEWLSKNE